MTIWLDAHLSPSLAPWLTSQFDIKAYCVRELCLNTAADEEIFYKARLANVTVMTKDADFVELTSRLGPPPSVIWLRCRNTSNTALQAILIRELPIAMKAIESGQSIIEVDPDSELPNS